jgi:saccharopine dehydrogenase-like NADP-dependent oxidoreductase
VVNVVLFGATGMVGQGVLRECLLDQDGRSVLTVGRSATGRTDPRSAKHGAPKPILEARDINALTASDPL